MQELQAQRATSRPPVVLDVRERWEYELCHLPDCLWIPMREVPTRLSEVPRDATVVVLCHHGTRSLHVAQFLAHHGYPRVLNLSGGIDAWARALDPSMALY